jgi:hypothetical protein
MSKLRAIWKILSNKCWFLAVSKTGMSGDQLETSGHYTYNMADALINKHITDVNNFLEQESAVNEFNNIVNGIK